MKAVEIRSQELKFIMFVADFEPTLRTIEDSRISKKSYNE